MSIVAKRKVPVANSQPVVKLIHGPPSVSFGSPVCIQTPHAPQKAVVEQSPPIGTGFAPGSDVTIHRQRISMSHPQGPGSYLYEKTETTEVRGKPNAMRITKCSGPPCRPPVNARHGMPPVMVIRRFNGGKPVPSGAPFKAPPPPFFDLLRRVADDYERRKSVGALQRPPMPPPRIVGQKPSLSTGPIGPVPVKIGPIDHSAVSSKPKAAGVNN